MRDYKTLIVWQKAHSLTVEVYRKSRKFPPEEIYGLTSQMRRAVVSIAANIAEGFGRQGDKERAHYISMALGSAHEVEYYVLLAHDLGFITEQDAKALDNILDEVLPMLRSLLSKLQQDSKSSSSRR